MAEGIGYTEQEAREILARYREMGGDMTRTNIASVMAGQMPPGMGSGMPSQAAVNMLAAGPQQQAGPSREDLLMGLLLGRLTGPQGSQARHQVGAVAGGGGFAMDALDKVLSENIRFGPAPSQPVPLSGITNANDLVAALLQPGTIAADNQMQAKQALIGGMKSHGVIPPELMQAIRQGR